MTTLKQVFIAVVAAATAAVSVVHATPLASPADDAATPTSVAGVTQPATTQISQPLRGKELEDFLASRPFDAPEGSIDISNTTLATELTAFLLGQTNHGSSSSSSSTTAALAKRSGPCDQGNCPDFSASFDLYEQRFVVPVGPSYVDIRYYFGRWNDCGQCGMVQTSSGGCFDFTSCGRPQSICIDQHQARAHRIWKDVNFKACYRNHVSYYGNCGIGVVATRIDHPVEQVACNW